MFLIISVLNCLLIAIHQNVQARADQAYLILMSSEKPENSPHNKANIYLQVPNVFRSLKHLIHTLTGFLAVANWASLPEQSLQKMFPQFRQ